VFKEDGQWVIVDYKTDDFEGDEARKRAYERQVEMYGRYWEKISGERVKERVLVKLI
jgi:ATP-dependent exoDNAse (exonuclease V) beta subunit